MSKNSLPPQRQVDRQRSAIGYRSVPCIYASEETGQPCQDACSHFDRRMHICAAFPPPTDVQNSALQSTLDTSGVESGSFGC